MTATVTGHQPDRLRRGGHSHGGGRTGHRREVHRQQLDRSQRHLQTLGVRLESRTRIRSPCRIGARGGHRGRRGPVIWSSGNCSATSANQHVIMGSRGNVDIVEHVASMDDKLANMRVALEDLTLVARDHDVRIDGALCPRRRRAVRRLPGPGRPAEHGGGLPQQPWATAWSSPPWSAATSPACTSSCSKTEQPDIPLAPEEQEAVDQARGAGPFTIRPRSGKVGYQPR